MVFDRTLSDVKSASQLRANKVQKFVNLTDSEIEILERGTITINTLNRIEQKQSELSSIMNDMGYWNTNIVNKNWSYDDVFNQTEFQRIVDNNAILRRAFFVYSNSPKDAVAKYYFEEINALEKILHDLGTMIEYVKESYLECDTFYSGEA